MSASKGVLAIGHGMCSAAFRLRQEAWTLELHAVDAAGNAAPSPTRPLRFRGLEPKK